MDVSEAEVNGTLAKLEGQGLVEHGPKGWSLTPQGRSLLSSAEYKLSLLEVRMGTVEREINKQHEGYCGGGHRTPGKSHKRES